MYKPEDNTFFFFAFNFVGVTYHSKGWSLIQTLENAFMLTMDGFI